MIRAKKCVPSPLVRSSKVIGSACIPSGERRPDMGEEALAFVAGYVAAKCQHLDPGLGVRTEDALLNSVPASWIRAVSQGGLFVPSPAWMVVVREFENIFRLVMNSYGQQPGKMRRLLAELMMHQPSLDARICRKLVSTRLHLRIRWLNQARTAAAAARRAAKQIRQHAGSGR